jgi:protein-L-isoaspartate(D-aspartate) O-methyltransferase
MGNSIFRPLRKKASKIKTYRKDREVMVGVIKENYLLDSPKVLKSLLSVPREKFVEKYLKDKAHGDHALSIGFGQTISQPYTVAFMTHLLDLKGGEKVLEIGTGSGYQAAVLSNIAGEVYTVEIIPELAKSAAERLNKLGFKNVFVKLGNGEWGWEVNAPYDAIIITAALEKKIPKSLVKQLKKGGIIVAPIGPSHSQTMTRFIKDEDGKLNREEFSKFVFVPFVRGVQENK